MSLYKNWVLYPKILQEKDWDKQKGIIAKAVKGETGITDHLKKAKKAFDKIQPAYFSDATIDLSTKASCATALQNLSTHYSGPVKGCCDELLKLKTLASKKEAEFKKSRLIPKSTRVHVGKLADEAQSFSDEMRKHIIDAQKEIKAAAPQAAG